MTQEYHRVINSYDDIEAQKAKNIRIKQLTDRLINLYEIRKMIFPQRQLLQNNLTLSKTNNMSQQRNKKDSQMQLSKDFNSSTLDSSKDINVNKKKLVFLSHDQSSSSIITRFRKQMEQKKKLRNLSSCDKLLELSPQKSISQERNTQNQNKQQTLQVNLSNNSIHLRRNFYKTRSFTQLGSYQSLNQEKDQSTKVKEVDNILIQSKKPRKYSYIKYSCQTNDSPLKPTETSRISKDHETILIKELFKKFNNEIDAIKEVNVSSKNRRLVKRSYHKRNQTQDLCKVIQNQLI